MGSSSDELPDLSQTGRLVPSRLSTFGRPREGPGNDFPVLEVIKTGHLVTRELEQNQSKRALAKSVRGGFSLRKKPLGMVLSGYSYSGFAVAERLDRVPLILWNLGRFPD
jgi:hypothetical protein